MPKAFELTEKPKMRNLNQSDLKRPAQRGASLLMVMLILVVVSVLGIGGAQIALMSERGARNDRDQQVALQAAEAALMDAEFDLSSATGTRSALFDGVAQNAFVSGCGTSGNSIGLCALNLSGKPAWLVVDYLDTSSSAPTVELGKFTGRAFAAGSTGVQPARKPRYVIEMVPDVPTGGSATENETKGYLYRVTAIGFGPRVDIQAMLQMLYRK